MTSPTRLFGALSTESSTYGVTLAPTAALVATTGALWLFHLYARVLPDEAVVAAWFAVALGITFIRFWRARIHRERLFASSLTTNTPLRRWFRGGPLLALWHGAIASILAAVLVLALTRLSSEIAALVLFAGLGGWLLLEGGLRRVLNRHAHPRWLPLISAGAAAWLGVPILVVVMFFVAFGQPQPDLQGVALERAVWHFVDGESARSALLQIGLEFTAAVEGLRHWLVQQFLPIGYGNPLLLSLGWGLILVGHALFAFALLSFFHAVQVLSDPRVRTYYRVSALEKASW